MSFLIRRLLNCQREIFEKDNLCFVITIRELEILLYLHRNDKPLLKAVTSLDKRR